MPTPELKRAVIYCRVSTKEQVEEGNSLVSQERYCKEYAQKHGYEVTAIFIEQGESAKTADRTELKKMLSFCTLKKNAITAVIAYKIDRISRNTDDYSQIRIILKRYNIEIKSTTEYFENTPSGKFMENMMANVAQFDNDVRAERSIGGMKEAVREGRYVWKAPYGYSNVRINGKATIAPNEYAPIVYRVFEAVATSTTSLESVRKSILEETKAKGLKFTRSKAHFYSMLKTELYTGWITMFGERVQGSFLPVISEELFNRVQYLLSGKRVPMKLRVIKHPDFPLRNFIKHPSGLSLTGCWAKGKKNKYPYYKIHTHNINIRKEKLEKSFVEWLNQFKIDVAGFEALHNAVKTYTKNNITNKKNDEQAINYEITTLNGKKRVIAEKIINGVFDDEFGKAQIIEIDSRVFELKQSLEDLNKDDINYSELLNLTRTILLNPGKVWEEETDENRRIIQSFYFPEGIIYDGKESRTPKICRLFKLVESKLTPFSAKVNLGFQKSNTCIIPFFLPLENGLDNKGYKTIITLDSLKAEGEKLAVFASSFTRKQNVNLN